jgi:hypothetical protein
MASTLRHTAAAHQQYDTTATPSPPTSYYSSSNGSHGNVNGNDDMDDVDGSEYDHEVNEITSDPSDQYIDDIDEEDDLHIRHAVHHHHHDQTCGFRTSPSTDSITSADHYSEEINPNVEFFGGKGFWAFYIFFLFTSRLFLGLLITAITTPHLTHTSDHGIGIGISIESDGTVNGYSPYTWTLVNVLHTCVTFVIIHWLKGTPFWIPGVQGRYDKDTFWEQIDDGRQYTTTRKILTLIPVTLFLLANYDTQWHIKPMIINLFALGFAVVPKHAALDHVRIFGINKD